MSRLAHLAIAFAALAALPACSENADSEEPVGAVTQSEAQALDEAAEMIEARRLPEGLLPAPSGDGSVAPSPAETPTAPPQQQSGGPEEMELPR